MRPGGRPWTACAPRTSRRSRCPRSSSAGFEQPSCSSVVTRTRELPRPRRSTAVHGQRRPARRLLRPAALKQAVGYDRVTGYFRSSSLRRPPRASAASLPMAGRCASSPAPSSPTRTCAAIEEGEPLDEVVAAPLLADPLEGARHRRRASARDARLAGARGAARDQDRRPARPPRRPLRRDQTDRYFHSKYGVFTDGEGNRVAFLGRTTSRASGLASTTRRSRSFQVWLPEVWDWSGEADRRPIRGSLGRAARTRVGGGRPARGGRAIELVARVKDRRPPPAATPRRAPTADCEAEDALRLRVRRCRTHDRRWHRRRLRDRRVEPWPHQLAIARRAVETYPRSYLLADEVGLGKTIEAGPRSCASCSCQGKASTALLLVPASVHPTVAGGARREVRPGVPRLDGGSVLGRGRRGDRRTGAGTRGARSRSCSPPRTWRGDETGATQCSPAGPWDVVLVDEAHHAGARVPSRPTRRTRCSRFCRR